MHRYHRIVWNEGLFLSPHHFQQWDLYQEAQLVERPALTTPYPWGIYSMEIDTESLARGTFRLLSLRGLLPNGLALRLPDFDPTPPSLVFKDTFDTRADALDIYLALPARRTGWANCLLPGETGDVAGDVRYVARGVTLADENTGKNDRPVNRAELNLKLITGNEPRDNYDCLQIARIVRSSAGGYALHDVWTPPLLNVKASPWLERVLRGLLERLTARSSELAGRFTDAGSDARDITPANLRAFLQFSMINQTIPMLAHFRDAASTHPETMYRYFATLAGGLATFNSKRLHPRDVPPYQHEALGEIFAALERILIDLLEVGPQQGYIVIPLVPIGEGRQQATFDRDSLLEPSTTLILAITGETMDERDVQAGASRVILASVDRIQQKINMRLPGLPLHIMAVPPPAIPRRRGTVYLQLDARGGDWEAIKMARNLAVDIPMDLRAAQFELLALEGGR